MARQILAGVIGAIAGITFWPSPARAGEIAKPVSVLAQVSARCDLKTAPSLLVRAQVRCTRGAAEGLRIHIDDVDGARANSILPDDYGRAKIAGLTIVEIRF